MDAGRNDPCPCGSGKKYKKCCLREDDALAARVAEVRRDQERAESQVEHFAIARYGEDCLDDAWEDFSNGFEDVEVDGPEMQHFVPWVYYDWKPEGDPRHRILARAFLDESGGELREAERRGLEAALATPMSFHDVLEVFPGRGMTLRDIILGGERHVHERSGSQTLEPGDFLFARIVPFGPFALMIGSGAVPFPPIEKGAILDFRKAQQRVQPDPEILKRLFPEMKALYFNIAHRLMNPAPPRFCNTDGDPLEFHTVRYRIESPQAALDGLKDLAWGLTDKELASEVKYGEASELLRAEIPWRTAGNKVHKSWDNTVLGHIEVEGETLTVRVNSLKRAKRIRKEIEKRLRAMATLVGDEISSIVQALAKEKTPGGALRHAREEEESARFQTLPEVQAMIKEYMERHWESWIDEKIPALGGKTPRQAVRDTDGREMVEPASGPAFGVESPEEGVARVELA